MRMEAFFLTASSGNMINDMGYTRPSMRNIHPIFFYVCTHTGSMNRTLKMVDRKKNPPSDSVPMLGAI